MNKYELLVILSADLDDAAKDALIEKIKSMFVAKNGTVDNVEKLGMKKYAYNVNKKTEGFYVQFSVTADSSVPQVVTNQLNITDGVVRSMFLKK